MKCLFIFGGCFASRRLPGGRTVQIQNCRSELQYVRCKKAEVGVPEELRLLVQERSRKGDFLTSFVSFAVVGLPAVGQQVG